MSAIETSPLFRAAEERFVLEFTIVSHDSEGVIIPPRTKKNSAQLIPGLGRPLLVPSEAYRKWEKGARRSLRAALEALEQLGQAGIAFPVNVAALIYRDRNVGDANGFYQAIGDALHLNLEPDKEKPARRILADDRWIESWDGSRRLIDRQYPRVEVTITELR